MTSRGTTLVEVSAAATITVILATAALLGFDCAADCPANRRNPLERDLARLEAARTGNPEAAGWTVTALPDGGSPIPGEGR